MKLKLVNLATYTGRLTGGKILNKGDSFDFSEEGGEAALQLYALDSANNRHPYFERVDEEKVPTRSAKPTVTRRRAVAASAA